MSRIEKRCLIWAVLILVGTIGIIVRDTLRKNDIETHSLTLTPTIATSPTVTPTATMTPTPSPTSTPTCTPSPSPTNTQTPTPVPTDEPRFSEEDIEWLYKCVEAEEESMPYRAKYLVACCIINRYEAGWGNSLEEVIFKKNQFAVTRNGRIYKVSPSEETIRACQDAIQSTEPWVMAFGQGDIHSEWADLVEVIQGEYYYKLRGE